jgi:hypothetical protein
MHFQGVNVFLCARENDRKMKTMRKRPTGRTELANKAAETTRQFVLAAFEAGILIGEKRKRENLINYEELIEILKEEAGRTSQRQLALAHGLTPPQLNSALKGKTPISAEMAGKLGFEELRLYAKKKDR